MLHTFIPSNIPINEQDIIAFEELIGVGLPQEYREFIVQYNGGEFENAFYKGSGEYLVSPTFYYLTHNRYPDAPNWLSSVEKSMFDNEYLNEIIKPDCFLQIGDDTIGNIILLSIEKINFGYMYIYTHDTSDIDIRLISHSFSDIINNMQEMED